MLRIEFQNISKTYPAAGRRGKPVAAVREVTCAIEPGEIFFLLGPSGCGKTTLLRMLAGFVEPTGGRVLLDGQDITATPAEKRGLAMVFQNYALWPHMTVSRNVEFGPTTAGWNRRTRKQTVRDMLDMVGMTDRAEYRPQQLSGGQQQRVALARALAVRPRGLLLDEPLSNLDARLRARMRGQIRRIVKESGCTAVYVTHDQEEALSMADRIAVMNAGRVVQVDSPREVYSRPANRFVADFLGEANFIEGTVAGHEGNYIVVRTADGTLRARHDGQLPDGSAVTCCFRPEAVRVATTDGENAMDARRTEATYFGQVTRYELELASGAMIRALALGGAVKKSEKTLRVAVAPAEIVLFTP